MWIEPKIIRRLLKDIVKAAYESGENSAVKYFVEECVIKPHVIENLIHLISIGTTKVTYELGRGFFIFAYKGYIRVDGPNYMEFFITYSKVKDIIKSKVPMYLDKYLKHKPFKEVEKNV